MSRAVFLSKEDVARSHLETAIMLWFEDGDVAPIHTLAVAANDCFHALGKKRGIPTKMKERMKTLSRKQHARVTASQNYFKHGDKEIDKFLRHDPAHGEVLMFDSVLAVLEIFGDPSLTMRAFWTHFILSHPVPGFDIDRMVGVELFQLIKDVDVPLVPRKAFLLRYLQAIRHLVATGKL